MSRARAGEIGWPTTSEHDATTDWVQLSFGHKGDTDGQNQSCIQAGCKGINQEIVFACSVGAAAAWFAAALTILTRLLSHQQALLLAIVVRPPSCEVVAFGRARTWVFRIATQRIVSRDLFGREQLRCLEMG